MKGGFVLNILNKKLVVLGILLFLSILVISVSIYTVYAVNESNNSSLEFQDTIPSVEIDEKIKEEKPSIYVEVKGAVNSPGVYEMEEGQIVNDAITKAGGFLESAYTDIINLSKKISDELVIYVYTKKEYEKSDTTKEKVNDDSYLIDNAIKNKVSIITGNEDTGGNDTSSSLVNINIASIAELTTLPGIGEAKAQKIITYREENGYFKTIEELKNVSGIGDATFEQLKTLITV